jgi:purine-binding chemotaxis protein CheW
MTGKSARFDWKEIHKELESRLSHLGATIESDSARVQALLRERTAQLAAVPRHAGARDELRRAIVLCLGTERYALAAECAQEVTRLSRAAIVPGAGPAVVGIVNWRGEFVTVFDLALLLGLTPAEDRAARRVVVLRGEEPRLALAVDGVEHIAELNLAELQPADQLRSQHAEFFKGATTDALVVLDEVRLLASLREDLQAA